MKKLYFIFIFTFSSLVSAETKIIFFEVFKKNGDKLQLEENGKFSHLAISTEHGWLHSHPYRGVEIVKTISDIGFRRYKTTILYSNEFILEEEKYNQFIGLPYDPNYLWDNNKIYCSELVAKLLKIEPSPMTFSEKIWGQSHPSKGKKGISPDEIYNALIEKGFLLKTTKKENNND